MAEDKAITTEKEVNNKVDKLESTHIIKSGDSKRFGDIAKDLMHQADLVQDLYQTSLSGYSGLMVLCSGRYQEL